MHPSPVHVLRFDRPLAVLEEEDLVFGHALEVGGVDPQMVSSQAEPEVPLQPGFWTELRVPVLDSVLPEELGEGGPAEELTSIRVKGQSTAQT